MGVIINGQERKSVAEQVEENSKYKGRFVGSINNSTSVVLYKKDLPCFVRVIVVTVDEGEDYPGVAIYGGNGPLLYEMSVENKIKDLLVMEYGSGVKVWEMNGTNLSGKSATYGQNNKALQIDCSMVSYCIVIPLKK